VIVVECPHCRDELTRRGARDSLTPASAFYMLLPCKKERCQKKGGEARYLDMFRREIPVPVENHHG